VLADQVETLTALRRQNLATAARAPVDGYEARVMTYLFSLSAVSGTPPPGGDLVLDKHDVIFLSQACVWTISLSAPEGTIEAALPVLEEFLAGFRVLT
jgi:hypothetical protein